MGDKLKERMVVLLCDGDIWLFYWLDLGPFVPLEESVTANQYSRLLTGDLYEEKM